MRIGLAVGEPTDAVAEARWTEAAGFDVLACGEHLFFHGATTNGLITLAAAAGATERVELVSTITLLPLYPAALVAKMAATLDLVSGGRFGLGLGAGGENPPEFAAAGVDVASRFRRLDEGLDVIGRLLAGETVTHDGEFARLDGLALDPPPTRRIPIWLAGRKEGGLRRAARHADVWLPYMVTPQRFRDGLTRLAELTGGRPPDGVLYAFVAVDADGDRARRTGIAKVSATYAQDFTPLADRYLLLGTPEDVVARLAEFAEAGAEGVVLSVAADGAERRRVLDTLATDVVPRVRNLSARRDGGRR